MHFHFIGHDESRIEAHAKLTDQLRILLLIARELLEEVGGARFGDRAQMGDRFITGHTDTVIANRERLLVGVVIDPDLEVGFTG